ncbi:MAG: GH92 family glycosyl hydrolase [Bacteroidales bacterium]|nr:GH92 family glycosyl hydrolase [Bacteroidales bacterium]
MSRSPFISALLALALVSCAGEQEPARLVNVFNGSGFSGNTYPGATLPYGMVQLSPDTDANSASGYRYADNKIQGFSHNHLSGTGCPDLGDFLVTPGVDKVEPLPLDHQNETAAPGYYKVTFPEKGITAELTATERTGVHRYTFSGPGKRLVSINTLSCVGGWCTPTDTEIRAEGKEILAHRRVNGWADNRDSYFSAVFSAPFVKAEETSKGIMTFIFADDLKEVTLFAGLSGVSAEGARKNRLAETEGETFESTLAKARETWNRALSRIRVKGGPADVFYTNLYHTLITPNRIDDVDGWYRDQSAQNRQLAEGHHFYSTLSLWDTFRSWNPLQTLMAPDMVADMVNSMLDQYRCRGELPIWPLASDETGCMIAYHSVSVIADAWLRGIRSFDGEKALEAMIVSSNMNNANASELYNAFGYIPADMKVESVSQTLEFCYDDWCIARMAESLGHADIAAEYDKRSLRYRALYDPNTGFFRGKKADGNWVEPLEPLLRSRDFTEASPWHYRFFVPHDMAGLQALMGGREPLYAALDSLFTYKPEGQKSVDEGIGGIIGQYAHGNEPSHNMAWLFNFVQAPSRTQEVVRQILTQLYTTAPDGICGNEDCGQMSAWYVLAALGLYPVCPGTGEYQLVAPLFKEITVELGNGNTLVIKADHPERAYVSDVTLNGAPVQRNFLTYEEIMAGGTLEYKLSARPDPGRDNLSAGYSLTHEEVVCPVAILGDIILFPEEAQITLSTRTEGAAIHYTLDGSEPTEESALYTGPFTLRESAPIRARAFKEGMEPSFVTSRTAHKLLFHAAADRTGMKPGCRYTYHAANFVALRQIEEDPAEATGTMPSPSIAGAPDEDHFAYCFYGYIDIPEDGIWSFYTKSDDGSSLSIDGTLVVGNDGSHSAVVATGRIPLQKGLHAYKLLYFEDYEGQYLEWGWKAPSAQEYSPIPANRLFYR